MATARSRWQVVVAAIAVLGIAAATGALSAAADLIVQARTRIALEQLLADLPADTLPAARFSAIPAARLRSSTRGAAPVPARTEGKALTVLAIADGSSAPDVIAARAAALAIRREAPKATRLLEEAVARMPAEARLWSDLAAAHLETNQLLRALVAADQALRIEPQLVPALHNRALILDRLGLTPAAAQAWSDLSDAARDADVAILVRERLQQIEAVPERARWTAVEKDFCAAADAGNDETLVRLAGQYPSLARASAEATYPAKWAEAANSDRVAADRWLRIVRNTGSVLRRRGEMLVADAVAAIDEAIARHDSARLSALAQAYLAYDRGRRAYARRDHPLAERELREAAERFQAARSPMEQVARSYIGSVLFERARYDEASRILAGVLTDERRRSGHRALVAHAEYLLALCDAHRGRWNAAAEGAKRSAALFRENGEVANAADSEALLAAVLDLVGQRDRGWRVRLRAFESASAGGALDRVLVVVGTASRAALRARDRDLALSFLDIEVALATRLRDPLLSADLFTRRALLQHERRAFDDRDTSLGRARAAISAIASEEERTRLTIELGAAEAIFVRDSEPARAVELLGRAVRFCEETDRRMVLPAVLLQRGRAHLAAGDRTLAWRDFSAAIDELDAQRGAIASYDLRSRLLDTAAELFEEAIALQVREGDAEEAFRLAERARGRSLLDVLGGDPQPVTSSSAIADLLAPDTLLIEYAVLPEELVIFTIRNGGMRLHRVPARRDGLASRADLAAVLLGPVSDEMATARRLIIVPDGILQRVAFGALRWNGRFLVQTHVITEAPSASRLAAAPARDEPKDRSILIVGNPAADPERNLDALPRVRREIAEIRASHAWSRVLFGADATKERFTAEAPRHDVIHFAGHGLSDEQSVTAALVLHDDTGGGLVPLETADIAALELRRGPLVVLSACGTLRGSVAGVEGMPSVARAFIAAGASAVVGTLVDIDDEQAGALLTTFHRRIAAGAHPADALRDAQLEAIARGGDAADPSNWAQFVLYSAAP